MRVHNITYKLLLLLAAVSVIGCGTSKQLDFGAYVHECIQAFSLATDVFFKRDYKQAKILFQNYHELDTTDYDYESYAFLAECYNQLGMQDSGKIVYENIINRLKDKGKLYSGNTSLAIEDLNKWYSIYPKFPAVLKKENGFVPYDKLPDPIGGIVEIQKNVIHPSPGQNRLTGRVFIMTLVNEAGKAVDFHIHKSIAEAYDKAAIEAIKKISFTIPKRKGRPSKVWIAIPIVYN